MATRVGIELAPAACRVVEIQGTSRRRPEDETEIRSFAVLPPSGPEAQAKFQSLQKQTATVVVWGVPNDHRQVVVTNRSYESMRREALAALAGAGIETRNVLADIAPATKIKERRARQPVSVSLAAADPISDALRPLTSAGIHVTAVMTPAVALTSLARTRREFSVPESIDAYVALDETVTCIALVRDGALITARELSWGWAADIGYAEPRPRADIAVKLADELSEFFGAIGASPSAVGQVCVCGGLPELRSMTVPLMERLDVEVETLDSLYGIDVEPLLERADEFRDRCAELRVAWAAAADPAPPLNLLRPRKRQATRRALSRAAIVAGTVAGLGVGWQVQRTGWWRSMMPKPAPRASTANAPAPAARSSAPAARSSPPASPVKPSATPSTPPAVAKAPAPPPPTPPAAAPPVVTTKPVTPPPPVATAKPVAPPAATPTPPPPSIAAAKPVTPPLAATKPAAPTASATKPITPPAAAASPAPPPPVAAAKPVAPPPLTTKPAAPPTTTARTAPPPPPSVNTSASRGEPERSAPPRVQQQPPAMTTRPAPAESARPAATPPVARTEAEESTPVRRPQPLSRTPPESAMPFEAALGTILYSPDRKLAIIDGRIIGVGDEVRGARVTDITPSAVFLRDAQGRLRRLALGSGR